MRPRSRLAAAALVAATTVPGAAVAQTIGVRTNVDVTGGPASPSNEISAAISRANPLEVVIAYHDYRLGNVRMGVASSFDGGVTWIDSLLRPPPAFQTSSEGDPMTAADDRTGILWAGAVSFGANGGVFVARKDPGQPSFGPALMAAVTPSADKGWMAAGPDPSDPNLTRLYVTYNEGLLVSTDLGSTWSGPTFLDSGLSFLPRVGPSGELYVAYWDFGFQQRLLRSFDGGVTFGAPIVAATRMDAWGADASHVPGSARVVPMHGFAVDPNDGMLYYVFQDTTSLLPNGFNLDIYFTRSADQGTTWSTPIVINGDAVVPGDQFFPWIEVDESGRIHMVFHDTRAVLQNDVDATGFVDSYYSFSTDRGASWSETRLTSTGMNTAQAFPGGSFIGDYLGLATAGNRTLPTYVDNGAGDSDVYTHVVTHDTGTIFCAGLACPCGNDGAPGAGSGCRNAAGEGVALRASGDPAQANVVLSGAGFPAMGRPTVIVLQSVTLAGGGLGSVFGDGRRCIGSPDTRVNIARAGQGTVRIGIPAAPPGTAHYQLWYRNHPSGFCDPQAAFNLSNGLSIAWP